MRIIYLFFPYLIILLISINSYAQGISRFKEDMSKLDVDLFATPLKFQTLYNMKDLSLGFEVKNYSGTKRGLKYGILTRYHYKHQKVYDPFSDQSVSTGTRSGVILYDIVRKWENVSYFLLFDYTRRKYGDIYPIERRISAGFLGFKYHIYKSKLINKFDISYIPLLESEVAQTRTTSGGIKKNTFEHIRNSFRFRFNFKLLKNLEISELLWWKPLYDYKNSDFDIADNLLNNTLTLKYTISDRLSFLVKNIHTHDIRNKRLHDQPASNNVTEFFVNYKIRFEFLERWKRKAKTSLKARLRELTKPEPSTESPTK